MTPSGLSSIAGQISGTGSLVMAGSSMLTLSSSLNNYSGGTSINSGIIQVTAATSGLGSGAVTETSGAELLLSGASLGNTLSPVSYTHLP